MNKKESVKLEYMRITKSGPRYYINLPKKLIKYGIIDPDKIYHVFLDEVEEDIKPNRNSDVE